ncbi:conserved Plasmodium protein, unknown function [Babesia microti strain RI]|uniref:CS domain-containing protein n=1 Tax=Babesia microti (strain RI) TaxID=1133968 RepID=A0A1R4ACG0_BABMR|nr:conserved Plasmodium protein, unknown function [Babesia microti strain RI]SJK86678.1 conserved Plasmodium protein, unknown function [Babesia microti strain RI]|eukprot:XP_021338807.1 conserved Plasmodium protein, unknown function [Babesia microti strain RI]
MPIDYSKWDALLVTSSDDEPDRPIVTKFDKPKTVTIPYCSSDNLAQNNTSNVSSDKVPTREPQRRKLENYCINGGIVDNCYAWGQSRFNVWAIISLPPDTKGKNLNVVLTNESLTITDVSLPVVIIDKTFPFTVNSEYDYYNWEILPHCNFVNDDPFNKLFHKRVIFEITLTKLEKFEAICSWWPCFFQGDPSVDVESFKDRKGDNKSFMKNWEEANRMFREKVANFQKIEL